VVSYRPTHGHTTLKHGTSRQRKKGSNEMTDLKIYRLAMKQLLLEREAESKRLSEKPNVIAKVRLERIDTNINYLHDLIIDLEQIADSIY
jgi:hypothetical protein